MSLASQRHVSLNSRRWRNFRRNRRAFISLIIFSVCFVVSLFAELLANDRPILVKYRDGVYMPIFQFYSEQTFGGDLRTEAIYGDVEVQCLIVTGGLDACWATPELLIEDAGDGTIGDQPAETGWIVWPLIPYHHSTISTLDVPAPSPPDSDHWLGTDDTARDVLARIIYGLSLIHI